MHSPYRDPALDRLYHALFCDDPQALVPADGRPLPAWQACLLKEPADAGDLRQLRGLAADTATEARVRALAWRRLQQLGHAVPQRLLLGVVVEVPLDSGLDTLAAYADGRVRFLHGSGRCTFVDSPLPQIEPQVQALLSAGREVLRRIGPSDQQRRAPPQQGMVRMSFIVSDGLYFGEGPMNALMTDALAGPVLSAAIAVLDEVTGLVAA